MTDKSIYAICLTFILIVALVVGAVMFHTRQFINGGYCEGSLPGIQGTAWLKCNTSNK